MIGTKKRTVIQLIASGRYSLTQIAETVGVNQNTLTRWKQNSDFCEALKEEVKRLRTIQRIDNALSEADFEGLDVDTLLRLKEDLAHA